MIFEANKQEITRFRVPAGAVYEEMSDPRATGITEFQEGVRITHRFQADAPDGDWPRLAVVEDIRMLMQDVDREAGTSFFDDHRVEEPMSISDLRAAFGKITTSDLEVRKK